MNCILVWIKSSLISLNQLFNFVEKQGRLEFSKKGRIRIWSEMGRTISVEKRVTKIKDMTAFRDKSIMEKQGLLKQCFEKLDISDPYQ